jgi:hypothetical protein
VAKKRLLSTRARSTPRGSHLRPSGHGPHR